MSDVLADFPAAIWNGLSLDTQRVSLTQISSPSGLDYQQIVAELRAAQTALLKPYSMQVGTRAKVGGTAGFVVGAADNLPYVATLPADQSASTLVIPIDSLKIGDTITGFKINAQVESAGGTVTIDAELRAVTNVAADPTDAEIGDMDQVSVTADTAVVQASDVLSEVVTAGKSYYLLITATTGSTTDIILLHPEVTVQPAY